MTTRVISRRPKQFQRHSFAVNCFNRLDVTCLEMRHRCPSFARANRPIEGRSPENCLELGHRRVCTTFRSQRPSSDRVIDIFEAAGLKRPDISILSEEFLAEVRGLPQKNLAVELLKKLLQDELKIRSKRHLVQSRSFSEMLERALNAYKNRAIETAQVIEELMKLAKQMRVASAKGQELGLTDDELAFYDALGVNDAAVEVMGDKVLRAIARALTEAIRRNVTIDWTQRETEVDPVFQTTGLVTKSALLQLAVRGADHNEEDSKASV